VQGPLFAKFCENYRNRRYSIVVIFDWEMNKKGLDNKTLDSIGRKLIERSSLPESEIDKIVANGDLFSLVQKRVVKDQRMENASFSPLALIRKNVAVFASVAVMVTVVAASGFLKIGKEPLTATVVSVSAEMPEAARPIFPPLRKGSDPTPGRASNYQAPREITFEKASLRQPVHPQRPKVDFQADGDFYAVSSTAGMDDAAGDGRIIRVDMPRSSLFAMGVNVPLENGAETVKADLLVGPDGITRAIRVVK